MILLNCNSGTALAGCSMKEDVKGKISPPDWARFFLGVPAPEDARRGVVLMHFRLSSCGIRNDVQL